MSDDVRFVAGDGFALLASLEGESVDLIATDPPFGIEHDSNMPGSEWVGGQIIGDDVIRTDWLADVARVLRAGCAAYVFTRWDVEARWADAIRAAGLTLKQSLVWDRGTHGSGDLRGTFGPSHERVLFATKGRHILRGSRLPDVLRVPAICSREWRWHPHEKPVDLLATLIAASSDEGGLVVDPCAGSATTLLAARKLGRRALGAELDPKWHARGMARLAGAARGDATNEHGGRQLSLLGGDSERAR